MVDPMPQMLSSQIASRVSAMVCRTTPLSCLPVALAVQRNHTSFSGNEEARRHGKLVVAVVMFGEVAGADDLFRRAAVVGASGHGAGKPTGTKKAKNRSIIAAVNRPVNVFCWLT